MRLVRDACQVVLEDFGWTVFVPANPKGCALVALRSTGPPHHDTHSLIVFCGPPGSDPAAANKELWRGRDGITRLAATAQTFEDGFLGWVRYTENSHGHTDFRTMAKLAILKHNVTQRVDRRRAKGR